MRKIFRFLTVVENFEMGSFQKRPRFYREEFLDLVIRDLRPSRAKKAGGWDIIGEGSRCWPFPSMPLCWSKVVSPFPEKGKIFSNIPMSRRYMWVCEIPRGVMGGGRVVIRRAIFIFCAVKIKKKTLAGEIAR